jgi:ankyrin repeat protein
MDIDTYISPLVLSCYIGSKSITNFLLRQKNIDIDFRTEPHFYSPLHIACMMGNFELVEILLQ